MSKSERESLEEIVQLKRNLEKADLEFRDREVKIKDLQNFIEQIQGRLDDKEKVISDLNRRLNERAIGGKTMPILTGPLPVYTGLASTNTLRDYSSTLSSTS